MLPNPIDKEINREMRALTAAVFRVTEKFSGGEILKNKIQEKALDIFAKSNPHFDDAAIRDINILKNFFGLAGDLNLTKSINCDVLAREYDKILELIKVSLRGVSIANDEAIPTIAAVHRSAGGVDSSCEIASVSRQGEIPRNDMKALTERQKNILDLFKNKNELQLKEINKVFSNVTSRTLRNDLRSLLDKKMLERKGMGAGSIYKFKILNSKF